MNNRMEKHAAGFARIINFGSLNLDHVHRVEVFAKPGETIHALDYHIFLGGKGLNQSIAAARAGSAVLHAGAIGQDGDLFLEAMRDARVDISQLKVLAAPSGHTAIEIDHSGQNRIVVYGGTNQMLTEDYVDAVLDCSGKDDLILLQNETNLVAYIMEHAHRKGRKIAFNPSPMPAHPETLPLHYVDYLLVNELEAAQLVGTDVNDHDEAVLDMLHDKFPDAEIVMTLGQQGVQYLGKDGRLYHPVFCVAPTDTTGAGDTFCGYFLAALCRQRNVQTALREASAAAAIAVSRMGAVSSIPMLEEVEDFLTCAGTE